MAQSIEMYKIIKTGEDTRVLLFVNGVTVEVAKAWKRNGGEVWECTALRLHAKTIAEVAKNISKVF